MKIVKQGKHRLFESDPETSRIVSEILLDIEKNRFDAVKKYSARFDDWAPASFELSAAEIDEAIAQVPPRVVADTDECQGNVRAFAKAQFATLLPLETEIRPGVILGPPAHPRELRRRLRAGRPLPDVRLRPDEHHPRPKSRE